MVSKERTGKKKAAFHGTAKALTKKSRVPRGGLRSNASSCSALPPSLWATAADPRPPAASLKRVVEMARVRSTWKPKGQTEQRLRLPRRLASADGAAEAHLAPRRGFAGRGARQRCREPWSGRVEATWRSSVKTLCSLRRSSSASAFPLYHFSGCVNI
eukprot:scaffold655_cov225-Pinguiococcus_pyrenoidosus.AAC.26